MTWDGSTTATTNGWVQLGSGTIGTGTYTITTGYTTPSGLQADVKAQYNPTKKEIGATLYIKYVKSKLGKVQIERVKKRLSKLQKLVAYSREMGQQALYEELTKEVAVLVRESELAAFNIDKSIEFKHIDKFRSIVKEKVIKWDQLENFPRVVPRNVQTKVKALKKAGIFDEFWILFIDYTKQPEMKSTKEKIRQKDPILFGRLKYQPDRYYYIADWVDEYCDLTLDKLVDKIKLEDKEFALSEIEDISEVRWNNIVHEVKARINRLEMTNASNFRQLMEEEEKAMADKEHKAQPWYKRVWGRKNVSAKNNGQADS